KLASLNGCSPLELYDHCRLEYAVFLGVSNALSVMKKDWSELEEGLPEVRFGQQIFEALRLRKHLLDLSNVEYLLTTYELGVPYLRRIPVTGPQGQKLYVNQNVMPRAYWTPRAMSVNDNLTALQTLISRRVDFRTTTVLTGLGTDSLSVNTRDVNEEAKIRWRKYSPQMVSMEVQAPGSGVLVLVDSYFPGWRALVDGKETPIYPANSCYRGVVLPAGRHEVTFLYQPSSFHTGLWISAGGFLLWLVLQLFRRRPHATKPAAEPAT
ncbi:MAG: YfhO family protein, partial [bacterium]